MQLRDRTCRECGNSFKPRQHSAMFCGTPCRMKFNKRRRERGAELYDVFMSARIENNAEARAVLDTLTRSYLDSDTHARAGRHSWQSWRYAQMQIPQAYSKEGDKR